MKKKSVNDEQETEEQGIIAFEQLNRVMTSEEKEKFLDVPLKGMLSGRTYSCLLPAVDKVITLREISKYSERYFRCHRGIGKITIIEISDLLSKYDLSFKN